MHSGHHSSGIDEREIWACALEALRQHGGDAAVHAAMRADELLEAGEREGAVTWQRIILAINALDGSQTSTAH